MAFWGRKKSAEQAAPDGKSARLQFAKKAAYLYGRLDWDLAVDFIRDAVARDKAAAGNDSAAPSPSWGDMAVSLLMMHDGGGQQHKRYILAQLDADFLAAQCRKGAVPWPTALEAKAGALGAEALAEFMALAGDVFSQRDLDAALRLAVITQNKQELLMTYEGYAKSEYKFYRFGNSAPAARTLLEKGASLKDGNADLLLKSVEQNNFELVRALVDGGADLSAGGRNAQYCAAENNHEVIAQYLLEKLWALELFVKVDEQTLSETKRLDSHGNALKLVFNFESRRVTEIFTGPATEEKPQGAMLSHRFDDYEPAALKAAFDKLVALGGHPRPPEAAARLDKAPMEKPAGFAPGGPKKQPGK
ncbi:MAG: hypothetical protein GC185_05730 [Alphaproteobacteria bacterium]|nr:hypothetical protein [Alphaproteobacteria bacterium]